MPRLDVAVCAKVPLGDWKSGSPTHLHEFLSGLSEVADVKAYVPYTTDSYTCGKTAIHETGSKYRGPVLNMYHFSSMAQLRLLGESQDIIHWRLDLAQELVLMKALKGRKVCEVNGPLLEEQAEMRRMPWQVQATARWELCRNLRKFDHVVVVSDELKALLSRGYGVPEKKISVVYNGVNTSLFSPGIHKEKAAQIKSSLKLEGKTVLGFVGGLRPWHGLQYAISMMAALKRQREDVVLLVVGSGHQSGALWESIKSLGLESYVVLAGAVPYPEVPAYIEAFDIALAPYPSRGVSNYFNPLKLFEYMSMEKPILCGNTSWAPTFLGADKGIIANCEDTGSFVSTIERLLNDPELQASIARNARKVAYERYTWGKNVEKMIEIYSAIGS